MHTIPLQPLYEQWTKGSVKRKIFNRSYEVVTNSRVHRRKRVHIEKINGHDEHRDRTFLNENNAKQPNKHYPIEIRTSNKETLKDDGIIEAVSNHDKTKPSD